MKSAALFPQFAGDPRNIQFLTITEHHYGAHSEDWKNLTNGRYDPKTGVMHEFDGDELPDIPVIELTDKYDHSQYEYLNGLGRSFGFARQEDSKACKERIKGVKSIKNQFLKETDDTII